MSALAENFPADHRSFEQQITQNAHVGPDGMFTSDHVGQLFFNSFRFSQGSPNIQQQIFQFLNESYGNHLSSELIEHGVTMVTPRIATFIAKGKHIKQGPLFAKSGVNAELKIWQSIQNDTMEAKPYDAHEMLTSTLSREADFLNDGGRPGRTEEATTKSRSDSKYLSQFVFYGLLGKDTGFPEYNAMFAGLVDVLYDIPDIIAKPDKTDPEGSIPIIPIFASHFTAYPDDVACITPHGLEALKDRFEPEDLQQMGISSQNQTRVVT